jgi:hypothetical protein
VSLLLVKPFFVHVRNNFGEYSLAKSGRRPLRVPRRELTRTPSRKNGH